MIILPYKFKPRPYQLPSLRSYFVHNIRFSINILHRRAGKTKESLNFIIAAALQRVGNYYHTFPELTQARRVIWNGIDKEGRRYIDHIPQQLIAGKPNNTDMRINLINGSSINLAGSDRYDALMGGNPAGIVFDEYSLQNPLAWHYLSPVLTENQGWAKFIYCVKPDTLIFSKNGIQEIGDIDNNFKPGFTQINQQIYGKDGFQRATHFYKSDKVPVVTITTKLGYELTCTDVHPVWDGERYKQAKDYKIDDLITIQHSQNVFGTKVGWEGFTSNTHGYSKPIPFKPDKDFYYFLGCYVADGSCSERDGKNFNCVITTGDPEVHERLSKFGFISVKNRSDQSICSNQNLCLLIEWLECGQGALNKQVPKTVLMAPKWAQASFLQGYFDGDGCATKRGTIHCDSISEKLLKTIQVMLLNFGIYSNRIKAKKVSISQKVTGKHLCWRLALSVGDSYLFFKKIGFFLKRKQQRLRFAKHGHLVKVDFTCLPKDYFKGINLSDIRRQFGRGTVRYNTLVKLNKIRQCDYIEKLLTLDYRFDKIERIDYGESEVVDFVIPKTHSFTSNGFISHNTPRGANHGLDLYQRNIDNPKWFVQKLDVTQTKNWDGSCIVSEEDIADRRREGMPEELIQQEFYCSFDAALAGSFYALNFKKAEEEKRIIDFDIDYTKPIHTAWDIGRRDANAIWFFQYVDSMICLIHYYENSGPGLEHYINYVREYAHKNGGHLGMHFGPHDMRVTEYTSGKQRIEHAAALGFHFKVVKKISIMDGINAVRRLFDSFLFHKSNCVHGIQMLKQYQSNENNEPRHDFTSHCADSLRYLAVGWYDEFDNQHDFQPFTLNAWKP